MADANEIFHAIVGTEDQSSETIDHIHKKLDELGHAAHRVGEETEHMHHPHAFLAIGEHVDVLKEHFGGLHASIGEVGSSISELLPAFAALGAAGTLVGLFETTEHVAEAYAEMAHSASALGMSAQQLHELQIAAKLTDTNVEGMEKSLGRLNRVLADTVAGKNKDVAALFRHLHLDPKSFKSGADALPALADAFEHTTDVGMRARMAFVLFGKAGTEMIPLLRKGGAEIRALQKEAAELGIDFTPYAEGLERYNEDQKKLNTAVGGFTDLLSGKLAAVLAPVIEESTELVLANREWITGDIAGGVKEFAGWLERVPWREVGEDIRTAAQETGEFVDAIGGPKVAIEGLATLMALKGVVFLAEPIKDVGKLSLALGRLIGKIGTDLVNAWVHVGTAANTAAGQELAAADVGAARTGATAAKPAAAAEPTLFDAYLAPKGKAAHVEAASAGSLEEAATLAEPPTAGAGLAESVRSRFRAQDAHIASLQAQRLRSQSLFSMVNIGTAAWEASYGTDLDKETVRRMPGLASMITAQQYASLPEREYEPSWLERVGEKLMPWTSHAGIDPTPDQFLSAPPVVPAILQPQQAPPPPAVIMLKFENAPPGLQVQTSSSPNGPRIHTNLGLAWYDDLGHH